MGLSLFDPRVVSCAFLFGSILPAQAEVTLCKEITAVPAIVNTSGIWCLKKNLTLAGTTGKAIDVQIGAVIIDLNGFTLAGSAAPTNTAVGIHNLNRTDVMIRNGTIRGFSSAVFVEGLSATNNVVEDIHVDLAQHAAIQVKQAPRAIIRNNQITGIGGATVASVFGVEIDTAKGTTVSNNAINGVRGGDVRGYGVYVHDSDLTEIRDNSILNVLANAHDGAGVGSRGVEVDTSSNTTIQSNRILNGIVPAGTVAAQGISSSGGSKINCINNLVSQYFTGVGGCTTDSGNITF